MNLPDRWEELLLREDTRTPEQKLRGRLCILEAELERLQPEINCENERLKRNSQLPYDQRPYGISEIWTHQANLISSIKKVKELLAKT